MKRPGLGRFTDPAGCDAARVAYGMSGVALGAAFVLRIGSCAPIRSEQCASQ